MRARRSSAWRTTLMSWARWKGLVRKSVAPSFIALTASSTVPKAVSMKSPLEGDGDGEGRAGAGRAGPPELALVLLHDLAADGQAKAGALRLRGEELLEQ